MTCAIISCKGLSFTSHKHFSGTRLTIPQTDGADEKSKKGDLYVHGTVTLLLVNEILEKRGVE